MICKSIFAVATVATLAASALISTEASAKPFKGYHGHWGRWAIGSAIVLGTTAAIVSASCYRWVQTRSGDFVKVYVCD
jgi:hypothetical protein